MFLQNNFFIFLNIKMSCTFKEPTWTNPCKTSIETQGLPEVLAGYSLTDNQKKMCL